LVIPVLDEIQSSYKPQLDPRSLQSLPDSAKNRYYSVVDYHSRYLAGDLTPTSVIESLLPLILRDIENPTPHSTAFIATNVEVVRAAAKASTKRYQSGQSLGLLDGVPTAIKDDSDVAGYRTTNGTARGFQIADKSSWPVQNMESAGAIMMGKLNMHELGADTTNNNPTWGTPKNPHNSEYYTGGSSGGSAYAVSAGLLPITIGADGGGSIRIPASFCGIYGLKPSHRRFEDTGSTVSVSGPLAANMADLETAYRVLAQSDPSDPVCSLFAAPKVDAPTAKKVIGVYHDWFDRADPIIRDICQAAFDYYRDTLGYLVVDIEIPYCPEGQLAHAFTILSEMAVRAKNMASDKGKWLAGLNPANQVLLTVGAQTPAQDYLLAQQLRNLIMQHLAYLYKLHPGLIIVTPVTPMPGWPITSPGELQHGLSDGNTSVRNMEYIWLANFCGNPAISCPAGYVEPVKGQGRIPIGIMGMGEWGNEDQLMTFGREAETYLNTVYKGGRSRPQAWVDILPKS
jgi:Asp-tRNA(Asn)/Glu-tRNA(Gln) amidotransferase A subunit family amidase